MIKASATPSVPWGYICGFPIKSGDLYGGGHYIKSAASETTLQGQAIQAATREFGNGGRTLPFTPCKRGYQPILNGVKMYACHFHHRDRLRRFLSKQAQGYRPGEARLDTFWNLEHSPKDKIKKH